MTRAAHIAETLRAVRQRIAEAEAVAGRPAGSVRLVAVSKKMPPDDVRAALAAGQLDFGENYANELRDKRALLGSDPGLPSVGSSAAPRWHYLGPLQRNKAKVLAGQVALIHSVADVELVDEIERRAAATGADVVQACLVQVNVAGESQKSGVAPEALPALLDRFAAAVHVRCVGLMVIPPLAPHAEDSRRHFAGLRQLAAREAAVPRPHVELGELSMGMSGDFPVAIEEGATLVRIGTAIFGERAPT
jgi:pyridoxal phosphate enzyme (YggS family)